MFDLLFMFYSNRCYKRFSLFSIEYRHLFLRWSKLLMIVYYNIIHFCVKLSWITSLVINPLNRFLIIKRDSLSLNMVTIINSSDLVTINPSDIIYIRSPFRTWSSVGSRKFWDYNMCKLLDSQKFRLSNKQGDVFHPPYPQRKIHAGFIFYL